MTILYKYLVFVVLLLVCRAGYCQQLDLRDWLAGRKGGNSRPGKGDFLLLIPVVASNPTAGVIYGLGGSYSYGAAGGRRLSVMTGNVSNSTRGMVNINVRGNFFLSRGRLLINSDLRWLSNTETTYGLGTGSRAAVGTHLNGYGFNADPLGQVLKYTHTRVYEVGSWEFLPKFFAGVGFKYDAYRSIRDLTAVAGDSAASFHYHYSRSHRYDPSRYTTSGVCLNLLYDDRDNELDTYRGNYANINYTLNSRALGSSRGGSFLQGEYRAFYSLDRESRNVLAYWIYGSFVTGGTLPYLALPALGYDQRQRTGRGFTYGRFRGEDLLYGECEYRFRISPRSGILGGVLFGNLTSTSDRSAHTALLDFVQAGYGGGLRVMLDKRSRTRIELDAGVGQRSLGFYFGVQETF